MSEVVDTGGWFFDNSPLSDKGKDVLSKKTVKINNEKVLAKLDSKFFGMDEGYFRYSWHPFIMTTEILIFLFIALFFMFKFSYLALNQAILLGFFNATAFTDRGTASSSGWTSDSSPVTSAAAWCGCARPASGPGRRSGWRRTYATTAGYAAPSCAGPGRTRPSRPRERPATG